MLVIEGKVTVAPGLQEAARSAKADSRYKCKGVTAGGLTGS